jgi:hypothetical protein
MRRYTIIGIERDGSEHELAHVDDHPDNIIYAAELKARGGIDRNRRYLSVYATDNWENVTSR